MKQLLALCVLCSAHICLAASPMAEYREGNSLYRHGQGDPSGYPQALKHFLVAAEAGVPNAQFYAGRMYQLGDGTPVDGEKAVYWYLKAGANGQARAYNNLGNIYADGLGTVEADPKRGMICYKLAANMGMAMGAYNVANVYQWGKNGFDRDYAQAREYYRQCLDKAPRFPGAWNNYGLVLRWSGEGAPSDYEAAEKAFLNGVAQGDRRAMFNLSDLYFDGCRPASKQRVLELLHLAADEKLPAAIYRLGWMYEYGILDYVPQDYDQSISYYEWAASEGMSKAQNQLALVLEKSGKEAYNSPRVVALFQAAANNGNVYAKNNLGFRIAAKEVEGREPEEGIALLLEAAHAGDFSAVLNLNDFIKSTPQGKLVSAEDAAWVQKQRETFANEAKQVAREHMAAIKPLAVEKNYEEALRKLQENYMEWESGDVDRDAYLGVCWWDAQTQQGRGDPEWSWQLFDWVRARFDHDWPNNVDDRLVVRHNISTSLIECGRLGQLHELADETTDFVKEIDGIDINAIFAQSEASGTQAAGFPLRFTDEMRGARHEPGVPRTWLEDPTMTAISTIAKERMLAADWEKAIFLCRWIEAWWEATLASDTLPHGDSRGRIWETTSEALLIHAQACEYLYQLEEAEALYRQVIDNPMRPYKGRHADEAQVRLALMLVRAGRADEVDPQELAKVAKARGGNKFDTEQGEWEARLAQSMALHARGETEEALTLVEGALAFAAEKHRPFLRLEALKVSVDLALADGRYEQIEPQLFEALGWTQRQGLKVEEPELYTRYIAYLRQTGQLDAALAMQYRQIELLNNLRMPDGLPAAVERLTELQRELAAAEVADTGASGNDSTASGLEDASAGVAQAVPVAAIDDSAQAGTFDLQPVHMVSVPLPGRSVEAIFTLTNLSEAQAVIHMKAQGDAALAVPENGWIVVGGPTEDGASEAEFFMRLDAHEQAFLFVATTEEASVSSEVELTLTAEQEGRQINSTWQLRRDGASANTAVIEAQQIEHNPFYLIPVFHHLMSADSGTVATVGLRTRASVPTRVEAYDEQGNLLFIDAEGNGSFSDPGDLLATRDVHGMTPMLTIENGQRLIELRYQPHNPLTAEPVEIEIQRSEDSGTGTWETDVVDQIVAYGSGE